MLRLNMKRVNNSTSQKRDEMTSNNKTVISISRKDSGEPSDAVGRMKVRTDSNDAGLSSQNLKGKDNSESGKPSFESGSLE